MEKISKIDKMIEKNFKFEKGLLEANDAYNDYITAQEDIKNAGELKFGTIKYYSDFFVNWMDNFNDNVNGALNRVNTEDALSLKEQITAAIKMGIRLGAQYQFMEDCSKGVAETLKKAEEIRKSKNK